MFTHLNIHSIYSKMRSTLRLEEIIALNESQHVALTDVNTVRGFINFVQTSQSKNVRPIAGVNLITNVDEVVILVENDIGYENMCRLITDCYSDPNRSARDILKKYSSGLFVLAHKSFSLKSLKDIIPNDRLFIELRPGMQEPIARKLSKKYKLEMIATFDNYQIYRPQIHENNGATKVMFPQEARLRNFTYASSTTIDTVSYTHLTLPTKA